MTTTDDRPRRTDRWRIDQLLDELGRLQLENYWTNNELTAAQTLNRHLIHELARHKGITTQAAQTLYLGATQ